ncbi:MAG: hypothetical protein POH28_04995 [Acidocella sp.]|nr:hypothetical protein [Acidocella sp.]
MSPSGAAQTRQSGCTFKYPINIGDLSQCGQRPHIPRQIVSLHPGICHSALAMLAAGGQLSKSWWRSGGLFMLGISHCIQWNFKRTTIRQHLITSNQRKIIPFFECVFLMALHEIFVQMPPSVTYSHVNEKKYLKSRVL